MTAIKNEEGYISVKIGADYQILKDAAQKKGVAVGRLAADLLKYGISKIESGEIKVTKSTCIQEEAN